MVSTSRQHSDSTGETATNGTNAEKRRLLERLVACTVVVGVAVAVVSGGVTGAVHGPQSPAGPTVGSTTPDGVSPADGNATEQAEGSTNATLTGTVRRSDGSRAGEVRVLVIDRSVNAYRVLADSEYWNYVPLITDWGELRVLDSDPPTPGAYVTTADADGEFSLSLPPGAYAVTAYPPQDSRGFSATTPNVSLAAGERGAVEVETRPPVSALVPPDNYGVDIGEASGERGETVEVPITVDERFNASRVTGSRATLTFNPTVVEVASVEDADMSVVESSVDNDAGRLSVTATGAGPGEEHTVASVRFRLVAERPSTTHLVLDSVTEIRTENGTVPVTNVSFGTEVVAPDKGNITVLDDGGDAPIEPYTDERGVVTTTGLQRAVGDWSAGEITTETLQRVVAAWSSRDPV